MDVSSSRAQEPSHLSTALPRPTPRAALAMSALPSSSQPATTKKPLISVFDWDDTLCPTTWLYLRGLLVAHGLMDEPPSMEVDTATGPSPLKPSDRKRLEQLENQVLELLQLAARFGPVFIVTAASLPWVVASAEHFLPRVRHFLLDNQHKIETGQNERVQVVSARDWYLHHFGSGGSQLEWKNATFDALCSHLKVHDVFARLKTRTDLVSIGDARFEQEACVRMEMKAGDFVRSKTMKLVEQPTLAELLEQVQMICSMYDRVCQYDCGLHLCVTRKEKEIGTSYMQSSGRVVEAGECALETLQLVQIDRETALEGPNVRDSDARLQHLLAAADSLVHKAHYAAVTAPDLRSEPPLAAVPGVRS